MPDSAAVVPPETGASTHSEGQQGAIDRHGKLMSEQAQAIEASWIENGTRKTKLYPQVNYRFVVLRFFKKDADEFVVVMKKRK